MTGPTYHARTHLPGGTDPMPGFSFPGPWITPTLLNDWGDAGSPFHSFQYRVYMADGAVDTIEFRGQISGGASESVAMTFPAGARFDTDVSFLFEVIDETAGPQIAEAYIESANGDMTLTFPVEGGGGGGGGAVDYILIRDEKTAGTHGGNFVSGSWQTRTLNTEVEDTGGHATLSSNQITLAAGTYRICASAVGGEVNRHKTRWQNVTDATTTLLGTSEYGDNAGNGYTRSFVIGRFTIASSKAFELQHRCETTFNPGFGVASNFGVTEVYAVVELWKEG